MLITSGDLKGCGLKENKDCLYGEYSILHCICNTYLACLKRGWMIGVYFLLIANSAPRYALSTNSSCLCLSIKNCLNYKQNPANENWFDFAVLIRSRESKLKAHMKARRFSDDCTQQMSGVSNETDSPPLFNAIPSDQREDFITEMSLFVPPVNSNYFNITTCFMVAGKGNRMFNPFTPTSDRDRISPYNINTISSRQVMGIKKNINYGVIS